MFTGLLRPPGNTRVDGQDVPDADFDVVLLVETATVADAEALTWATVLDRLRIGLDGLARHTLTFSGSNARRIGPVDHDHQGVFLFN